VRQLSRHPLGNNNLDYLNSNYIMNSFLKNRSNILFLMILVLLFAITANTFSQRRSEISSIASALLLHPESNTRFAYLQHGTTMFIDSGRTVGVDRGLIIVEKVGLGGLLGAVFMLPGAFIGSQISGKKEWGALRAAIIGGYIGYVVGSSYGVHLVAIDENPKSSLGLTLVSGFVSVGVTYLISTISNNNAVRGSAAIFLPIVFPIIYTELIE
jgi:hypothetical protein